MKLFHMQRLDAFAKRAAVGTVRVVPLVAILTALGVLTWYVIQAATGAGNGWAVGLVVIASVQLLSRLDRPDGYRTNLLFLVRAGGCFALMPLAIAGTSYLVATAAIDDEAIKDFVVSANAMGTGLLVWVILHVAMIEPDDEPAPQQHRGTKVLSLDEARQRAAEVFGDSITVSKPSRRSPL